MSKETPSEVTVATIEGDGIGPELIQSAVSVLQEVARLEGIELTLAYEPGGASIIVEPAHRSVTARSIGFGRRMVSSRGRLGYRKYGGLMEPRLASLGGVLRPALET